MKELKYLPYIIFINLSNSYAAGCTVSGDSLSCIDSSYNSADFDGKDITSYSLIYLERNSKDVMAINQYSNYIPYNNVKIKTTGSNSDGIRLSLWGPYISFKELDINVSGDSSDGINVSRDATAAQLIVNGDTTIKSNLGIGVRVVTTNKGYSIPPKNNKAIFNGSTNITTFSNGSHDRGYAINAGADIFSCGPRGLPLYTCRSDEAAEIYLLGSNSDLHVLKTSGNNAHAVYANGYSYIQIKNIDVTTEGSSSHGLMASRLNGYFYHSQAENGNQDYSGSIDLIGNVKINIKNDKSYAFYVDSKSSTDGADSNGKIAEIRSFDRDAGSYVDNKKYDIQGGMYATNSGVIDIRIGNGSQFTGTTTLNNNGIIKLQINGNNSIWKMVGDSSITYLKLLNSASLVPINSNTIFTGELLNEGGIIRIDNSNNFYKNLLTINGNYFGSDKSELYVNSLWDTKPGSRKSQSDLLQINGEVSGSTRVRTETSIGNVTSADIGTYSADVIKINGSENGTVFYGTADSSNAGIVKLVKNTPTTYAWTYAAYGGDGGDGGDGGEPIYSDSVPGYVLGAYVNMEQIRDSISHYKYRKGTENYQNEKFEKENFWARTWGRHIKGSGESRLDWKSNTMGLQMGYEFNHKILGDTTVIDDTYFSYSHANSKAYDEYRFDSSINNINKNTNTGSMKTNNFSLALSRTYLNKNGNYTDMLMQLSALKNKYYSNYSRAANNSGWAGSFSWEQGTTYAFKENFHIDPMYQVIGSYLSLKDFNDGARDISQGSHWDGLLRVGARIYYQGEFLGKKNNTYYLNTYYSHDFTHNGKAKIGIDNIIEKNSKQWVEFGVGLQSYKNKNTYFFLDTGVEKNIGGPFRRSYKINAGMTHRW